MYLLRQNNKMLLIANPASDTSKNFVNWLNNGCAVLSKVQYLFNKKLLTTAQQKPAELDKYLLIRNFSLQSQVTEKSTSMPLIPTNPNFKKRAFIPIFIFVGLMMMTLGQVNDAFALSF